jgi:hypothetical protein
MSGDHWIARNPGELAERIVNFQRHLEDRNEWPIMWKAQLYEPPRSIDQNALIHAMYADIAKQSDGEGVVDVRRGAASSTTVSRYSGHMTRSFGRSTTRWSSPTTTRTSWPSWTSCRLPAG